MTRLAFLASYNGSSARAITRACKDGVLNAQPVLMISNNAESRALTWAAAEGLTALHLKGDDCDIKTALLQHGADLVILSGYMKLVGPETVRAFPKKILNVHPALLPKYGGQGMYGRHVHQAVRDAGDKETGVTIHYVDELYDHGEIVAQKSVPLSPDDTAERIEEKVKAAEPGFYIETLRTLISA